MKISQIIRRNSRFAISYGFVLVLLGMALRLLQDQSWFLGFFFTISACLIIYVYSISKKIPGKYLLPGVLLLVLFQIYPAFYSGVVAFTNDSNGHQLSKEQAISAIVQDNLIPAEGVAPFKYFVVEAHGKKSMQILFKYQNSHYWLGNSDSVKQISDSAIRIDPQSNIVSIAGYSTLSPNEVESHSTELQSLQIKMPNGLYIQPQDLSTLEAFTPNYTYSTASDSITDVTANTVYRPNNNGQMVNSAGDALLPGWKVNVGWRNFSSIIHDQEIKRPLLAVLIWTFINAILLVVLSFLFGLALALVMNSSHLKSKRIYRTIYIIPMAIPSVLSILVWAGLFTANSGVIDRIFHISTPWLTNSFWARIAVLIVEIWLSFPYMFLICSGAIQSIPNEIVEAAAIDGAPPLKIFGLIKLPLVMRTLAPLLVASGAAALNNFGVVYLLTGGGPIFSNSNGNAGATDLLISYTYKLAFNSQEGSNYGLASALSILNFFLIAGVSIYGLRRMKTMEGVN